MVCPAESLRSMGRAQSVPGDSFDNNVELNFAGGLDILCKNRDHATALMT